MHPEILPQHDFEIMSDIGRAFAITAILAAALSYRSTIDRQPYVFFLGFSAGVATMADCSLAAAGTYLDPGGGPLFVPSMNPRTWTRPTLHVIRHCPVAMYLNTHGWRRFALAFFFHSRARGGVALELYCTPP